MKLLMVLVCLLPLAFVKADDEKRLIASNLKDIAMNILKEGQATAECVRQCEKIAGPVSFLCSPTCNEAAKELEHHVGKRLIASNLKDIAMNILKEGKATAECVKQCEKIAGPVSFLCSPTCNEAAKELEQHVGKRFVANNLKDIAMNILKEGKATAECVRQCEKIAGPVSFLCSPTCNEAAKELQQHVGKRFVASNLKDIAMNILKEGKATAECVRQCEKIAGPVSFLCSPTCTEVANELQHHVGK